MNKYPEPPSSAHATAHRLGAHELARHCDPASLDLVLPTPVDATGTVASCEIVGQERARAAVAFGIAMRHPGYHLFIMGPAGSGKRSLARSAIRLQIAQSGIHRSDWVYVNNFEHPHQPTALQLPGGRGAVLKKDMQALVDELRSLIPAAFESEEYTSELERLNTEHKERGEHDIQEVNAKAGQCGVVMLRTPAGFTFVPKKDKDVMSAPDFEALALAQRQALTTAMSELQEQLLQVLRASLSLRKEHTDKVLALDRATTRLAIDHAVDDVRSGYEELPEVRQYVDAIRAAVIDNADAFRVHEDGESADVQDEALTQYEVNLVVDAGGSDGTAIIEADMPSYQNLIGRIDHVAQDGMLLTDFRQIKAGHLHRANGGYLMVDALKLLTQPFAWDALKRALLHREIRIESLAEMFSLVSTTQLEPQPIPLDVKVVLIGERTVCQLLQANDPEFDKLFRVVADLDDALPRESATQNALACAIASQMQASSLLAPDTPALASLIDLGARRSGDATRISADVRHLLDVACEADHLARAADATGIGAQHVAAAVAARRARAARVDEQLRDAMLRDILAIDTQGAESGQVNGLAAYEVAGEAFGIPTRITATTRLGDGHVVDIQRETRMGGPVHAKGVLILAAFLAARYSRFQPHAIIGTLVFEQTYGLVEGDSASLAELVALLSSIADVPVHQNLAVTGSVDQFGNVQAVGGVNEKVEGFFDLCVARGLAAGQGAVIPASNVSQLMLRDDVIAAVAAGRFVMHAVQTVDQALAVLTGMPAGDPSVAADDTVNGRINRRLREYALLRHGARRFARRKPPRVLRIGISSGEDT